MSAPAFQELQRRFAAHLRDPQRVPAPEGIEDRRLQIYRELVFNNVRGFMRRGFPVIRRTLGDDVLDHLVRAWLVGHRARTPLFPRMPSEFVGWLATDPDAIAALPDWLAELAHWEWTELDLGLDDSPLPPGIDADGDLLAHRPVRNPLLRVSNYRWPVHRIGPDWRPDGEPQSPVVLAMFRDSMDEVGFMELSGLTARLLELLDGERTGAEAIHVAGAGSGLDSGALSAAGLQTLQRLRERGVLLGTSSGRRPTS